MPPTVELSALEQQKAELLHSLSGWSPEKLAYRPQTSSWKRIGAANGGP